MNKKCLHCPIAGTNLVCPSVSHPRFCTLASEGRYLDVIRSMASLASFPTARPTTSQTSAEVFEPKPRAEGRVNVGFLSPCLVMGGAEAWQATLAHCLDPKRFHVLGVVELGGGILPAMAEGYSGLCPVGSGREAARRLASVCDVLVTWAIDNLAGILAGLPRRPRVIAVVHAPKESAWGQHVYSQAEGIDQWVAVSELALEAIPSASRASAPSVVIWNAVDPARLRVTKSSEAMRKAWGLPDNALVAGYLGRMTEEKDPAAMIRLARSLPDPWRVVLVGDGFLREGLEAEVKAEGLPVVFAGIDHEAGNVLNAIDCLIVPSHYESFGLTLAEGLWMGRPVISTLSGIARLQPGLTRLIPIDAEGRTLANAVLADRQDKLGTASRVRLGRIFARKAVAPSRFAKDWERAILGLAAKEAPTGRIDASNPIPSKPSGCGCQK